MMKRSVIVLAILTLVLGCIFPGKHRQVTYRYDNLPDVTTGAVAEHHVISRWSKYNLTYFFINGTEKMSGDSEREVVRQAFAIWDVQTQFTFTEISTSNDADILIGWARGGHGDGEPFDGSGEALAHASYPNPYEERQVFLHFDDDELWVDSPNQNVDLLTVAAHEIGHNLGFDHSNDPNALMYPIYSGPHRFLSPDDIANAQSLYGMTSRLPEKPQKPDLDANPPQSPGSDWDGDGLSDLGEIFITGTDPNNPDSDADGLGDGVEVINNMNPLDEDMDNDEVSDGEEIAAGTNPFAPDQSGSVSTELVNLVSEFFTQFIELLTQAYQQGNPIILQYVTAGKVYVNFRYGIDEQNELGQALIIRIDYYQTYINAIRVISDTRIETDTCQVWTGSSYQRADGSLVDQGWKELDPATITMEKIGNGWVITEIQFSTAPAYCH